MSTLDPTRARTCKACSVPMVPRRTGVCAPEGYRVHEAHGYCSTCYVAPSADLTYKPVMWQGRPVGDTYLPTFHRYAPPPEWTESGLCGQTDPEAFFPDKGGSTKRAKAICAACPVAAECLDYALANREQYGIWGGKSEGERVAILREREALRWTS